jgi:hypothetical protein
MLENSKDFGMYLTKSRVVGIIFSWHTWYQKLDFERLMDVIEPLGVRLHL